MGFNLTQSGIRQHPRGTHPSHGLHRSRPKGSHRAALFALAIVLVALAAAGAQAWLRSTAGAGPSPPSPGRLPVGSVSGPGVGAPRGYGLSNLITLQARGPILINGDGGFTAANGVRGGDGSAGNPYLVSNWFIDAKYYPNTDAMIDIRNTTKYAVVENNKIIDLNTSYNWEGIQIGLYPYISPTSNVIIRHNEIQSRTAYGIALREGASNILVEDNLVTLDAARNWTYGMMTDRNTHDITFRGNYVNAYTSLTLLTVGIQVGDYQVTPDRPAWNILTETNTVTNATSQGIMADDVRYYTIRYNLVFSNYPGYKKVPTWPVRGIMIEEISNHTQVYGNEIYTAERAIEVASWFGSYFSNTIHDSGTGIFVNFNNAFKEARNTINDTLYDTTYWNVATPFQVPKNSGHTLLDVGSGVAPDNFAAIFLMANQTLGQVGYSWSGTVFNVSMQVGTRFIYDHQATSASQNLAARWTGPDLQLQVSRFIPTDVLFTLQSAGGVSIAGSFQPTSYYQVWHGSTLLSTVSTDTAGNLASALPSPVSSSYEIRFQGSLPVPTVTITMPANGTYATTANVQTSWIVNDTGPGIRSVVISVDGGAGVDVTTVSSYTLPGLSDGRHVVQVLATDQSGLTASQSVSLIVDTQPPVVSITSPAADAVVNGTTLLVTWTATDATSGVSRVTLQLDGGPSVTVQGNNYSVGGLTDGLHHLSLTAVDSAGLSGTVIVAFTVNASSLGGTGSSTPAVAAVAYLPEQSAVDISFTQPMNHSSVEASLDVSPNVSYQVEWVNDSHVRVVLTAPLVTGAVYQVTLGSTASTSGGASLQHPFLFQFLAGPNGAGGSIGALNWIPVVVIVAALLIVNWATAGLLVTHYRRNASRIRSTLRRVSGRYRGSLVVVYKRLAGGVRGQGNPDRKPSPKPPVQKVVRTTVKKVQRTPVKKQLRDPNEREVRVVKAPFPRRGP